MKQDYTVHYLKFIIRHSSVGDWAFKGGGSGAVGDIAHIIRRRIDEEAESHFKIRYLCIFIGILYKIKLIKL